MVQVSRYGNKRLDELIEKAESLEKPKSFKKRLKKICKELFGYWYVVNYQYKYSTKYYLPIWKLRYFECLERMEEMIKCKKK